ncbi:MAG: peptidoglycan recognition family protein, partial [Actinomycetes bacterium]
MRKLLVGAPTVAAGLVIAAGAALTLGTGPSAATVVASTPSAAAVDTPKAAPRPPIINDFIPYSAARKKQMAAYSWRHYHQRTWLMPNPKQIILHYTVSPNYPSVHNWFAANSPAPGNAGTRNERPGACTHFVVDKNGKIYQQVPLELMCRQVVGLNNQSIGIEFVEMSSASNV